MGRFLTSVKNGRSLPGPIIVGSKFGPQGTRAQSLHGMLPIRSVWRSWCAPSFYTRTREEETMQYLSVVVIHWLFPDSRCCLWEMNPC